MTRNARVLWLAKGLGRGGAERLLVNGAAHLSHDRYDVEVAYLLPWKDAYVSDLESYGLKVHCLGQRSNRDLTWLPRLRRLVREREIDLVHTHMPVPSVAARLFLGPGGPKVVHTEHNVWNRYGPLTYWANALTYRRNDAVIAVSQAVAESMRPRFLPRRPVPVEVVLHGVEPGHMRHGASARAQARALLGIRDDAYVIGTVGNFTPKKDTRRLLDAALEVRRRWPSTHLVLIGTGPLEDDLKAYARANDADGWVHFTGSRSDVPHLLPGFDVFGLSSLHEGLSIALVEAMASGVPAVCTRVGGVPEAMRHDVEGLLVPAQDTQALADALLLMARDDALRQRCAAAAIRRAASFDIAVAQARVEKMYDDVLAAP